MSEGYTEALEYAQQTGAFAIIKTSPLPPEYACKEAAHHHGIQPK